jgi:hypothetical protein
MTQRITITCFNPQQGHAAMLTQIWPVMKNMLMAGHRMVLTLMPETRSQAQNRLMWPLLAAFAKQLPWPVDGRMVTIDADDFKDILSAAFKGESVRLAMGLNGGVVLLGQRTSKFTKAQFSEWIEFLYATAADRSVRLPAWVSDEIGSANDAEFVDYETGEIMAVAA